jgi:hypothetical protein
MLRVHATSIRRNGMGVPGRSAPGRRDAAADRRGAADRATPARASAGLGCRPGSPLDADRHDRHVPDALAFINYLDRQMTRSTLTSILDMATAERGSRSLGETVMQLM